MPSILDSQQLIRNRLRRRRQSVLLRLLILPTGLALLLTLLVLALESTPGLLGPRMIFDDMLQRARRVEVSRDLVLIEFDRFPVPKRELARVVELAGRCGASAILLDVLMDREHLLTTADRQALSRALTATRQTVTPYVVRDGRPQRALLAAARREPEGYVNLWTDPDGVVRRAGKPASGELPPGLASIAYRTLDTSAAIDKERPSSPREGPLPIAFPLPEAFAPVRLSSKSLPLLRHPERLLKGRIVLIGYVSPDVVSDPYDLVRTPVARRYPGLYVHAAVINTVLLRNQLRPLPTAAQLGICFVSLLLVLHVTLGTALHMRPGWRSGAVQALQVLLLCLLYLYLASQWTFRLAGTVWVTFPLLAMLVARPAYPAYRRLIGELRALVAGHQMRRHPTFLAQGYVDVERFADPFARLNALVSLMVSTVRWNATQAVALALWETRDLGPGHKKRKRLLGILSNHLRRPTLGNWIRLACQLTRKVSSGSPLEPFKAVYHDSSSRAMVLLDGVEAQRISGGDSVRHLGLLGLRNRLRHGARSTMTPAECRRIFYEYRHDVEDLLLKLLPNLATGELAGLIEAADGAGFRVRLYRGVWPRTGRREIPDGRPGRVQLLEPDGPVLDLFPFVLMQRCLVHDRTELFFYERGLYDADRPAEARWGYEGPSLHCLPEIDRMLAEELRVFAERTLGVPPVGAEPEPAVDSTVEESR